MNKQTIEEIEDEFFICEKCKSKTKITDFNYQEEQLYISLRKSGLCGECQK